MNKPKTALVTGANSGIGLEITRALHAGGAHVIMAGRNAEALRAAANSIGADRLETRILDLASLRQIADFAATIDQKIDILINNAGVMTPPQSLTEDGYELQFGVNFLGHYALTGHLYPQLEGARVVTMSSGAYKQAGGIDYNNLRAEISYNAYREYAISKYADMLFMMQLHRLASPYLLSAGAHPGVTATALSRHMDAETYNAALQQFGELMPASQGALPSLYAATAPGVKGGDYFGPDGDMELKGYPAPAEITDAVKNEAAGQQLWEFARQATGIIYP